MIRVELSYKSGYVLYYVMHVDGNEYPGGITKDMAFTVAENCPYKELMLRALIDKCMDTDFPRFTAKDEWNVDLTLFGFQKDDGIYFASAKDMKLPSLCKCGNQNS